ncbi:MAG: AmmeMemoRadiSam system radical SAM enzyme [Lachnospiraceae bacterium]|nr:AmmeMemoRadiSam system radical SAM enzyme [Lachnospiraceae bacterium]
MAKCDVCHNQCQLNDGDRGICSARIGEGGTVRCANYGLITAIALDPIEKKPLSLFHPGSYILSVGCYGCNLRCPFCQNNDISYGFGREYEGGTRYISPAELAQIAKEYQPRGNIGVAFTYNEPLVGYEYVVDTAEEVHRKGLKTVLVSNGNVSGSIADIVIPHIDAMNIDLKGFTDDYYTKFLKGSRKLVMDFIEKAAGNSHLELTTLIVPGYNDTEEEMRELSEWVADLDGGRGAETIALHITRYFPRFKLDVPATKVDLIMRLTEVAGEALKHVFPGNV